MEPTHFFVLFFNQSLGLTITYSDSSGQASHHCLVLVCTCITDSFLTYVGNELLKWLFKTEEALMYLTAK